MVVLAACTSGDGTGGGLPATPTTGPPPVPPTTGTTAPATSPSAPAPAGSVTLTVTGLTLPDPRAGGTGLRLLVRAGSPALTVSRQGGAGVVSVCPVAGVTAPVDPGECADLATGAVLDVPFVGGVELGAKGAGAAGGGTATGQVLAGDVAVTYLPVDRSTTVVTPARPAGACAPAPCEATYSLTPARPGPFVLDGQAGGGRPVLVLFSTPDAGGSNRTLATVQGGGSLSITATLEAGSNADLLHHEQGPDPVAPVTAKILWP